MTVANKDIPPQTATEESAATAYVKDELARTAFMNAVFNLDEEGFNALAWMIYQQSKTAGGFKDREGWARVRAAAEQLPFIADQQKQFDAAAKRADEQPPIRVTK